MLGVEKAVGCGAVVAGSIETMRYIDEPGIDVLAHSSQHDAEEPSVTAGGTRLEEREVVLFALDGTFGAGACILVGLPERAISGDEGVQAVVLVGIGVDDAAIG